MTEDLLKEAREAFALCNEHESENRKAALDDLRFARLGEQWPEEIKRQRQLEGRPCLTLNTLPAFIRQVVNDARQNRPSIKVHPADDNADPKVAEIYNGLIRNIETTSRADQAYDTAFDFSVSCGFGYFRIDTSFSDDASFDLDLIFRRIVNPFSVWGDPASTETDSSDWNIAFVTERLSRKAFQEKYPGADEVNWADGAGMRAGAPWFENQSILVAEYWKRSETQKFVLALSDGTVLEEYDYLASKDVFDAQGVRVMAQRAVRSRAVTQYVLTGAELIEESPWAGKFIPIVPVYGDEVNVEGKRIFRSLIRDAKDPQRMKNYWRTTSTELVALAPKAPFIGPKGAFKTDQAKWETANVKSWPYIEFDPVQGMAVPPQRQPFAGTPVGPIQEAMMASDDMKAIMGLYDASLGAKSNETSGRAIMLRQREGDVSTFHFVDNLSRAIEHAGRILIDLIPKVYSGARIVRVLGLDGTASTVAVNQPVPVMDAQGQPRIDPVTQLPLTHVLDLGRGRYDLNVEAGPSFTTRREEAAQSMLSFVQAFPQAAPVIGDLLARNLDWPEADEIARRLKATLPPNVQATDPAFQALQAHLADLQKKLEQVSTAYQAMKADKGIESVRANTEQFRAETDRMELLHKLRVLHGPAAQGTSA